MTKRFGRFLRQNTIALLALFIALSGTTFAAAVALPRNSVGTAQLKNGAVTKKKINKKTIRQLRGNRGRAGPIGPQGPTGARGPTGAQGAAGSAAAYARVLATGAVDASFSKNVASGNVTHPGTGKYCIGGLPFAPKNAVASPDHIGSSGSNPNPAIFVNLANPAFTSTGCTGKQIALIVVNGSNTAIDHGFYIAIN
jgi:hypothetical protein